MLHVLHNPEGLQTLPSISSRPRIHVIRRCLDSVMPVSYMALIGVDFLFHTTTQKLTKWKTSEKSDPTSILTGKRWEVTYSFPYNSLVYEIS